MNNVYRTASEKSEPESKNEATAPVKPLADRFFDFLADGGWIVFACGLGSAAVLILMFGAAASADADKAAKKANEAELPARQQAAERWLNDNGIRGRATCFVSADDASRCDVVPQDARPPFVIECTAKTCQLGKAR